MKFVLQFIRQFICKDFIKNSYSKLLFKKYLLNMLGQFMFIIDDSFIKSWLYLTPLSIMNQLYPCLDLSRM